jgi:hypothetical protein
MLFKKIKKFTVLQVTALLLAAVFAMVVTACPEGGIGGTEKKTPTAADYDIGNLNQTEGSVTAVTITQKNPDNASPGKITIHYEGIEGKNYTKSQELPSEAGTYKVTFDVAAADGWNAVTGLSAGNLVIGNPSLPTPQASDYNISDNMNQTFGSVTAVTVTKKDETKSSGEVTVYYEGISGTEYTKSQTLPTTVGTYAVTFDVAPVPGSWNAASSLPAGTLIISNPNLPTPVAADYDIGNLNQTVGSVTAVTITKKDETKSSGEVTVYYEGINGTEYTKSQTLPTTVGTYAVTFDVAAVPGSWNVGSSLVAGTLTVASYVEPEINYITGTNALTWGVSTVNAPATLGLTPGKTTTEINLNWYSSGTISNRTAQVRFVRGTFTAGKQLLEVTGTAAAAGSGGNFHHKATVTGLQQGASYQYAVSSDGTNWSDAYDFKVPAATGAYKFAVVADPQLTTGNVDANSRYPATTVTTAQGWIETMQKIVAKGVSFIVSGGDQVDASSGNENEYTRFFAPTGLRSLPFAPVSGNHDNHLHFNYHYNLPNAQTFANETTGTEAGRNYFYLYNNILFVVLNTAPYPGSTSAAGPNVTRFDQTLTAAKAAHDGKYDWLIVHHHKSTASVADHLADRDIQYYVEAGFEKVMSDHKVDFVLAGHDHVYARSYPLEGKDGGKVSVPDKTANVGGKAPNTYTNPGKPIYLTFTTGSGLKYYAVSSDPTFNYNNTLYVKDNAQYPYLGEVTDAAGTSSTYYGSTAYMNDKRLPVSNAAFVQPYIPSYTIAEVNGKTIKFSTYPIATKSGTNPGVTTPYSFNEDTAYDWVEVTKTN